MEKLDLTILMPCLNEALNLQTCINKAQKFLKDYNIKGEILIVDNGSTDHSKDIMLKNKVTVVTETEKGYGSALLTGINKAKGKYIIMGDSDASYDFYDIKPFYDELKKGAELVVGNRFAYKIEKKALPWLNRYIGNPFLSYIARKLFPCPVHDFHCGLRGFSKDKIMKLDLKTSGMEFASEMIIKAVKQNYKIIEIPIKFYKSPNPRKNHLRPFRDGMRHLILIIKLKLNISK